MHAEPTRPADEPPSETAGVPAAANLPCNPSDSAGWHGFLQRPPSDPYARTLCPVGEAVAAGIVIHLADGTVTECNRAAEKIFGFERSAMIGCNPVLAGPCRSFDAAGRLLGRTTHPCTVAADTGAAVRSFELGVEFPDRPRRYVMMDAEPIPAAGGRPLLVVCTIVDITARKELELALRAGEARFRTYLENATEAVFVHDLSARFSYVNREACRSLGYTEEELLRLSVPDIDIGFDHAAALEIWRTLAPGSHAVFSGTHRRKDGTTFPVEVQAGCFAAGGKLQFIGHARDITERLRAQAAERAHHDLLRRLGDNLPHGYIYRLERPPARPARFTYLGAGVTAVHGLAADRVLADPALLVAQIHETDLAAYVAAAERSYRELTEFALDVRIRSADGTARWLSLNSTPCRRDDGTVVWDGVAFDITARRVAEDAHLVRGKLESTAVLAAGLAHDFNNLLAVVLLNLDRARAVGADLPSVHGCLAEAARAVDSARGHAAVGAVARDALQLALRGSNVTAAFELAPDLRLAEIDAGQIAQVFRNLALNAREAMPAGGRVVLRAVNHPVRAGDPGPLSPGDYVRLSLIDEGPGIPADILPRVFDPYFSTKQRGAQKGMGLGLTLCRSVVAAHRGALELGPAEGRGTRVDVSLPALGPHAAPPPAARMRPPPAASAAHILVMDDDESLRAVLGLSLELMGHRVALAADSHAAFARFHAARAAGDPFRIALLDVTVPGGLGGLETWRELRTLDPALRSIVMSGYADGPELREWAALGFSAALTKPFESDALAAALARALSA